MTHTTPSQPHGGVEGCELCRIAESIGIWHLPHAGLLPEPEDDEQ